MSHYTPMHARDGQRRDAIAARLARLRAAARDTWVLIRLIPVIPMIARRALPRATAAPAPASGPAQEKPRPGDHQRRGGAARSGPGQPQAPGAVAAGTGTSAGDSPPPAAAPPATPSGESAATLPRPAPSPPGAGPGQAQRPAWVTYPGEHPMPAYKGDYARTQPFRAVGPVAVSVVRPYYPAVEARRDSTARWGA